MPQDLIKTLRAHNAILTTAESCTGGMIASMITAIAGASDVFDRGFITYSNASKTEMLGVPAAILEQFGAVSEQTAKAMAEGALARSNASITIATTGIAGPSGGTPEKPVGLVYIACAIKNHTTVNKHIFNGNRTLIQQETCEAALNLILETIKAQS